MNLGENIHRLRTEKNMSQGDLADALDVSRQSVSKWENNSAVPELEKLIKMSELFGVTLDELVSGNAPQQETTETPVSCSDSCEPKIIYVEKPTTPKINTSMLVGAVLLLGAFLYALLLNSNLLGLKESILMAVPVAFCGIICLFTKYPQFYCGWVGSAAYWIHFLILFHKWENQPFLIILGVALAAAMVIWTIDNHIKKKINIPMWLWWAGILILIFLLFLLCLNTVPHFWISTSEHAAAQN